MSLLTSPFVPEGMVDLMKKLSKGVIKEQPSNIYEFAAEFFEKMLIERDGSLNKGYGKFRSYTEYCKFMDKMDQRRLSQTTKKGNEMADKTDTVNVPPEEIIQSSNIEIQGVGIQGVERKGKDSVKNVSINPKYKSQSEKTAKPVVPSVKSVKTKPRKLSSKKPSENLIVIKEETSADVDDTTDVSLHKAAATIQKAYRMYISKKGSQDENSSEAFGNVSQLSEDAAAVIIQKAFKSLIQKLKPETQNREKAVDESNNNTVIPGDGQENAIIVNKIINNPDDHSEQILVDSGGEEAKHDLEHGDTLQENALEDTAANSKIETIEATNLEMSTTLEATGTQRVESEENQIEESKCSSEEGNKQLAPAFDNNHEAGCNEDLVSLQENESLVTSATIPLDIKSQAEEIQEGTNTDRILMDECQSKESDESSLTDEVKSTTDEPAEITSESSKPSETEVKNVSDDPTDQAETETTKNITELTIENKPNFSGNEEAGKDDTTEPLNSLVTDSGMEHSITVRNNEQQVIPPEDTTSVEPSENNASNISAQEENVNDVNDHVKKSGTDEISAEEKAPESPAKQQLFVVEKDGIYVNMDLLQEKLGTAATDDEAGSDSEKTFKLNILEREEILVNQENVQHINEEVPINSNTVDKSLIISADDKAKIVEEMESTEGSSSDIRDEEGNEEYELAETVVLMDIPSKSLLESKSALSAIVPENECIDAKKLNKANDETDKFESCANETKLEMLSDLGKTEDVVDSTTDEDGIMKNEAIEQQSNKTEDLKSKVEAVEEQIIAKNSTVSTESVLKDDDIRNDIENVENQLNLNELLELHNETILEKETAEEQQTEHEKVDNNDLPAKKSEILEMGEIEKDKLESESKNESVELNKNEVNSPEIEKIEKENVEASAPPSEKEVEEVLEVITKSKNINLQDEAPASKIIEKVEAVLEVKGAENENVEGQATKSEIMEKVAPVLEVKEAENEAAEVQATESETMEKMEVVVEVKEDNNENVAVQAPTTETIEKVEPLLQATEASYENIEVHASEKEESVLEVKKVENETVEFQATESEMTEKVESVIEGEEVKNETAEVQPTELEKSESMEAVLEVTEAKNEPVEIDFTSEQNVKLENQRTTSENIDNQSDKNELTSSDAENIVNVETVEQMEGGTVENQLDSSKYQETDVVTIVEVEDMENDKSTADNLESQLTESERISSEAENIVNVEVFEEIKTKRVEDLFQANELQATNSTNVEEVKETAEVETKNEKDMSLLSPDETLPNLSNSENTSVTGSEVKSNIEQPDDKDDERTEIPDQIMRNKENEELVKAATIIQKVFRGYIVRNSSVFNPNSKKNQPELWAALIIQKYARGYLVRKSMRKIEVSSSEMKNNESNADQTEENSHTDLVPQLPAYSNRFLIPKDSFLERESFADDEDYARTCKELAATSIQKTYRGYRVRRSLKTSTENDAEPDNVHQEDDNGIELYGGNDQVQTAVTEAERVISDVLNVAADVLPSDTYDQDSFEDEVPDEANVDSKSAEVSSKPSVDHDSVLGQVVCDNIHVEGQMQQKYNQITFQGTQINPIEELSDSSEKPDTPPEKPAQASAVKSKTIESDSLDSKDYEGSKSFSYEQLSSDLSDTEENKRASMKESEVDETSRDERDDLSEVENFDLSSCGEDSLEAMYYSLRKNEIMVDRMQKQVAEQREPKNNEVKCVAPESLKVEFPERVTENLDVAMQQVFKSMESSSDYDVDKKDEDDNSSTLDLALDDSSSINDEREIETSRHIKPTQVENLDNDEQSESTTDTHQTNDVSVSPEPNMEKDGETSNMDQSQQSDSSVNSSTRFIMKSQSVSEDMMNPIMFAMKRKQALLDQLHVRPYPLQENLSEDHDAFPEHLLSDIDIGNIQRKIFASSVSETDSDYIEPNTTGRRLVRDDFNISTALDHLSTDSDSTIISAATKIQAGARGFLTRRRLRRSSAGGTSISFEKRYSFGNAAIDKSLEDLIKMQEQINLDGAALKIQQQYRRYQARKNNLKKVSPIREQTTLELSGESSTEGNEGTDDVIGIREITLAQKKMDDEEDNIASHPVSLNIDTVETMVAVKRTPVNQRRLTLQRGDAVQRNSRPDSQELSIKDGDLPSPDNQSNEKCKDSETGEYIDAANNKKGKKGECDLE